MLDRDLLRRLASNHEVLITIEEGSIGGFAAQAFQALSEDGLLDGARGSFKFRSMMLPDVYLDQDAQSAMLAKAQLDARAIVAKVMETLGDEKTAARALVAS